MRNILVFLFIIFIGCEKYEPICSGENIYISYFLDNKMVTQGDSSYTDNFSHEIYNNGKLVMIIYGDSISSRPCLY